MTSYSTDPSEISDCALTDVVGGMHGARPRTGFGRAAAIGSALLMTPGMVLMTTQTMGSAYRHAISLHDKEHQSWPSAIGSTAKQALFGPMLMD